MREINLKNKDKIYRSAKNITYRIKDFRHQRRAEMNFQNIYSDVNSFETSNKGHILHKIFN